MCAAVRALSLEGVTKERRVAMCEEKEMARGGHDAISAGIGPLGGR